MFVWWKIVIAAVVVLLLIFFFLVARWLGWVEKREKETLERMKEDL